MAYDRTAEYEANVLPLLKKLMAECDRLGIPAYFSCAVSDDGKTTEYKNDIISCACVDRELSRDLFPKYALVYDGFNVVPYNDVSLIEEEMRTEAGEGSGKVTITKGLRKRSSKENGDNGGE